jgi:hypothetical protein
MTDISGINFASAIYALRELGVLPVITLGAVVFVARSLYKSFRK